MNTQLFRRKSSVTRDPDRASSARRLLVLIAVLTAVVLNLNTPVSARQTMTRQAAAHLLEQSTFGPSPADVDLLVSGGYEAWLDGQFALPESTVPNDNDASVIRNQVLLNMGNGEDQLRQRMIFALGQIFVVSANKNGNGIELAAWYRLLSRNAFGSFRTLLREVTLSPTMGKYLDLAYSRCTRHAATCPNGTATTVPNENYAREMLQLFSIGLWELNQNGTVRLTEAGRPIPTYTQATLVEYARALTGWTFVRNNNIDNFLVEMTPALTSSGTPQPRYHDLGSKTLLSGVVLPASANTTEALRNDVDGVIASLMAHPNVAPFISSRLIRSLVTSNPTPAYIGRVAAVFAQTDGDLRATLTAILTDPDARTFTVTDGRLKDPILTILGLKRALGLPLTNPGGLQWTFSNLSQLVLTPPTVFSFYNLLGSLPGNTELYGPEFGIYPPALAIQRANFIFGILSDSFSSSLPMANAMPLYQSLAADPVALAEAVNQNLMFGRMSTELRDLIVAATQAITDTSAAGLRERARGALYLAATSSEYSVYSDTAVASASAVQPPTGLTVSSMSGNLVTLTWRAPLIGPAPAGYLLEGGTRPGDVLATIPINGTAPSFTFQAPAGSFYLRLRTVSDAGRSRPSSEIRLHVGATAGPTAPSTLSGYGRGSSVVLTWRNTFSGGQPTAIAIDVAQDGTRLISVPLPLTETWSYDGVPAGTYTFTVRATNSSGTSGSSNGVTMTFPAAACSPPRTPAMLVFAASGRHVTGHWQPPSTGTPATRYTLEARLRTANNSTRALGLYPATGTSISTVVAPGRYEVRVRAENICGVSGYTGWQGITVR